MKTPITQQAQTVDDFQLTSEPPQTQLATTEPSVPAMMQAVIQQGITENSVAVLERMIALKERMDDKQAERDFNAAFVALQADLPVIVASTVIQNRGKYERFEDVMRVVGPLLVKHGFSVSFSMDFKENRILETCHLRHAGGHSQSNSFAVRAGGKADSDTQADCKAATTAKRNALLNCLNIVIRQDALQDEEGDARMEGEAVTFEQAETLRELVAEVRADEKAFLNYAGAASYDQIPASRYDRLFAALKKKRGA